jgi:hypothetical protein
MNLLRPLAPWFLALGSYVGSVLAAQTAATPASSGLADPTIPLLSSAALSAAQLEQLLAPIALYPDALIALMLPAATAPADIVLAARHLRASRDDRSQIEHRSWDESVKSLTYYPDVLLWMDENLQWTKQVGEAFTEQPVDVMQAIQRLRARARAAGTLVDSPEQQVVADFEVIRIVPAQLDALYIPYYDPGFFFLSQPLAYPRPFMTFGTGLPVGSWLAFECDWRRHTIWVGNRHRRWHQPDWRQPVVPIPIVVPPYGSHRDVRPWHPGPRTGRPPIPPPARRWEEPPRPSSPAVPVSPGVVPPPYRGQPVGVGRGSGRPDSHSTRPLSNPTPSSVSLPNSETAASPAPNPSAPTAVTTRPAPRRNPDRPRPASVVPNESNPPPPSPAPQANRGSSATAVHHHAAPPVTRPREGEATRPAHSRPPPVDAVPTRSQPPPAAPSSASRPSSPPAAAPAATRTESDSERSVGRRPPNENQR